MHTSRHRFARGIAVAAAVGLTLAACDDDPTVTTRDAAAAAVDDDEADTIDQDGDAVDDDVVEVVLTDFAFGGLPASVPAGTRLTVVNDAASELHEVVAFRMADDDDRTVGELIELAPPELVAALGEPATVILAEPGGPAIPAVGDGTLSEPGRYALLCFIPTGVAPADYLAAAEEAGDGPPEIEGAGPPHFVHGMHAELTVE